MRAGPIHVRGTRNIVATHVHVYLFPTGSQLGSKVRAWTAVTLAGIAGFLLSEYPTRPVLAYCVTVALLLTIVVLLSGANDKK